MPKALSQEIDREFTLHSAEMIHTPGMIRWYQQIWRAGDKQMAFLQMSHGFPQLPGLLVIDILAGRIQGVPGGTKELPSITFRWQGPAADFAGYWLVPNHNEDEE